MLSDYQSQPSTILSRSRDSLRKLSRLSLKLPRRTSEPPKVPSPNQTQCPPQVQRPQFVPASPPPSVSPTSRARSSTDTAPIEDTYSAFYDEDPFRKSESPGDSEFPEPRSSLQAVFEHPEPDCDSSHNLASCPSSLTLVSDRNSTRSSRTLRRLKSLSRLNPFASRKPANDDQRSFLPEPLPTHPVLAEVVTDYLPKLAFEHFECAPVIEEDEEESLIPPAVPPKNPPPPLLAVQQLEPELSKYISHLQVYRYERVNPRDLTSSARTSTIIGYSPVASPLPPPSPSWLSRNVKDLEFYAEKDASPQAPLSPEPIPIPPPSLRPLYILPRSVLPVRSRTSLVSPQVRVSVPISPLPRTPTHPASIQSCADNNCPDVPGSPRSTASSVTLFVPSSAAASPVRSSFYAGSRPPSSAANRLSVIDCYRQSLTDAGNARFLFALNSLVSGTAPSQVSCSWSMVALLLTRTSAIFYQRPLLF